METAIANVNTSLLTGGVLVTAVLFGFLFNLRIAFISMTAIPLSLLMAVIILGRWGDPERTHTGWLGNRELAKSWMTRSLTWRTSPGGFRKTTLEQPRSAFLVVLDASIEVRSAVVYATFVVAPQVFVPVLTVSGIQGRLFAPLGLAYILAILASLLVAMTLTPALLRAVIRESSRLPNPLG
ncbi:MAG: efflux RND transporter permease subunit [Terriglobia bacterium]